MVDRTQVQYFLGAHTPWGFQSLYGEILSKERARAIYLLKGGAGCGKSTMMRQIASEAVARGYFVEEILCLNDPDSLDGVVIPQLRVAIADGMAPHVMEASFPGVVERYVNVGGCYDCEGLQEVRDEVMACSGRYRETMSRVLPCLTAAGEMGETVLDILSTEKLLERLRKRGNGIVNREIKGKRKGEGKRVGRVTQRFLSGHTSEGRVGLCHSVGRQCERVFELWDGYGVSHGILLPIMTGAVNCGYDVVACLNPMNPKRLEHLIVPELSLGFVTSSSGMVYEGNVERRIRLETMLDEGILKENRSRVRVYRKMYGALMEEISHILGDGRRIYGELEGIYHPYVDFGRLSEMTKELGEEVFL